MKTDLGRKTFNNKLVGHAVQEPQDGCLLTPEMGIHKKEAENRNIFSLFSLT